MRGRVNKRQCGWCTQKRAMLRLALLTVTPLFAAPIMPGSANAESPGTTARLLLPPLPLAGNAGSPLPKQQINPFCQPASESNAFLIDLDGSVAKPSLGSPRPVMVPVSTIQLASGNSPSASDPPAIDGNVTIFRLIPPDVPSPAEPSNRLVVGAVRHNSVVDAKEISPDVVEHNLPIAGIAAKIDAAVSKSVSNAANAVDETLQEQKVTQSNGKQAGIATITKSSVSEGSVTFLLNDDCLVDTSDRSPKVESETKSLASLLRGEDETKLAERSRPINPNHSVQRNFTISEPMEKDDSASITRGSAAGRLLLVPLPPVNDSMPMAASPSSDARIVKGSRPRVDVGVPPVAIARSVKNSEVPIAPVTEISPVMPAVSDIALANTKETDLGKANAVSFESANVMILDLKPTEVRSLVAKGEIRKVQIGDGAICSAVAAGPMQLQLIATRSGVTRIAVWSATPAGEEEKAVYEIRVGTPVQRDANDPVNIASTLTKSTKAAFPNSNLQVRFEKGQMIVEGDCESNESAKAALRMIRSACLLPVIDRVMVR